MNNDRRRRLDFCNLSLSVVENELLEIKESMQRLSNLKKDIDKLSADIAEIEKRLDGVYDDEWNAYGALPDNLQDTNMGFDMWCAIEQMQKAQKQFATFYDKLDELESVYCSKFMTTYNPADVIFQIDDLNNAIEECRETIKDAK